MLELHVPVVTSGMSSTSKWITEGLDAVVIKSELSTIYEGSLCLTIAGNQRDLAIATERASRVGGVVN